MPIRLSTVRVHGFVFIFDLFVHFDIDNLPLCAARSRHHFPCLMFIIRMNDTMSIGWSGELNRRMNGKTEIYNYIMEKSAEQISNVGFAAIATAASFGHTQRNVASGCEVTVQTVADCRASPRAK